jgi:putative hemolysin
LAILPELTLVAALILLNALFAGSELALISLREGQLARMESKGGAGAIAARLARDPNRFLSTIQIGITLAGLFASAAAAVSLSDELAGGLSFLGGAAEPVAIVSVTLVLSYFTLVAGELAPKRIAMQRAEGWSMIVARPLAILANITRPVVWVLSLSTDALVRLLGGDPRKGREAVTEEEIRELLSSETSLSPEQRQAIGGVFAIDELMLREVMIPRTEVFTLPAAMRCESALEELSRSGHSRAPVVENELDDAIGIIHLRDLVGRSGSLRTAVRPVLLIPESASVLAGLRRLREERQQMLLLVDEFSSVSGIVTTEDLVEEVVGEIYDEFDRDIATARRLPDGSLVVPGRFPLHDLGQLGYALPEGDYATVAGFVLDRLGRIPSRGDSVEIDCCRIEVLDADQRSVKRLRLWPSE